MKNSLVFLAAFLSLVSCGTMEAIGNVENANEDEFFVMISDINSEDVANSYERIMPDNEAITPALQKKIDAVVRQTEKTYAVGSVYKSFIQDGETVYVIYLLDSVIDFTQPLVTPGGRKVEVKLGNRASKWVLYRTTPTGVDPDAEGGEGEEGEPLTPEGDAE